MQKKDLTDILSATDMAAEKLCDIDPDWERSSTIERGVRSMLHPYYPLSYRVPVRERYGSTLLPATREQHDQNCTQSH